MQQRTRLIGIAGGSCSGKTTLAEELMKRLGGSLEVISFDDYFVGTEALVGQVIEDWESPTLYRMDSFVDDLTNLRAGRTVTITCNSRESAASGIRSRTIERKLITLVEGFLIFHDPAVLPLFDLKIFVDLPDDGIVRRRLARIEDGSGWDDRSYITEKLLPGHRRYVLPQQVVANVILDGTRPTSLLADHVGDLLR